MFFLIALGGGYVHELSMVLDQAEVRRTARVVFHGYWSTLPESSRPKVYLYGLSLGSFGAESILARST